VGFLSSLFGGENPIDTLSLDDLKITEIQLTKKVDDIHAEIRRNDQEVQRYYSLAKETTSKSEEISYAGRIKTLLLQKAAKEATQAQREKELRVISNITIIKEQENDLPAGVLKRLLSLSPEEMEKKLIGISLDRSDRTKTLDLLGGMTTSSIGASAEEDDDDLADILSTIRGGKTQSAPPNIEKASLQKKERE
jgi:hypothetical protein